MSTDFRNGDESSSRVRADSAIFSKISFLDTSRSNNSCVVHDVRHVRIIFELFSTRDGTRSGQRDLRSYLPLLRFNVVVTNLISKKRGGLCLNPQTWPMTLAQPRLRAHLIILQWYKFYGSFLWYPILSFQQRSPFLSFFHNRILLGVI